MLGLGANVLGSFPSGDEIFLALILKVLEFLFALESPL